MGVAFVVGASGCVAYTPDSLLRRERKWAMARTVGCLDVATEIVRDDAVPESSAVVDVTFGNRCSQGVHVDLSRLQVAARFADGVRLQLAVYDPRHEIEPKLLAPAGVGHETLEFDPKYEKTPPRRVCITVEGVDADRATATAEPMCFGLTADGSMAPTGATEL